MKRLLWIAAWAAIILVAIVLAELPPLAALAAWIDARETDLLLAVGGVCVLGLTVFMGGILKLLMDREEPLGHVEAEDVARSVRVAAEPVTWRASSYRVYGYAAGRQGSDSFALGEFKSAWRSGALRHDPVWRRRAVTVMGALLLTIGVCGVLVVVGPPWIKVLIGGALLYALGRLSWAMWRA